MISIVLPTFNGSKTIQRAILSVISQTFTDWELLVVNDASTDKTEDLVSDLIKADSRIKYFKNNYNLGITESLKLGIANSSGDYIARIDDDDEWILNSKLEQQIKYLQNNKDVVIVGTAFERIDESGKIIDNIFYPNSDELIRKKILSYNPFCHSSVLFKKEVYFRAGGYLVTYPEDYDLWLRMGQFGHFANLPIISVRYLVRNKSLSYKKRYTNFLYQIRLIIKYKQYPRAVISIFKIILAGIIQPFRR